MRSPGQSRRVRTAVTAVMLVGSWASAATAHAATPNTTVRVSLSNRELQDYHGNSSPSISGDGRYVTFDTASRYLVPGDTNRATDVFLRDVLTGRTRMVSLSSTGAQGNADSFDSSISADGRHVAFTSLASDLAPGDANGHYDVFVRDVATGSTRLVSTTSTGAAGNADSYTPSISANGRYVAFASLASDLVPGDTNGQEDVFVHDSLTGRTRLVSLGRTGAPANNYSGHPSISADGRHVAFDSYASNLVPRDRGGGIDAFVRDLRSDRTRLVSLSSTGEQSNGFSGACSISADGRYVAFMSDATNLVPGDSNDSSEDVLVRDVLAGQTRLVSVSSTGGEANSYSTNPSISGNGRYVAFQSPASNLVPDDTNSTFDVFVRDLVNDRTSPASRSSDGAAGNGPSSGPSMSRDGRYVAFVSVASNLVPNDTNSTFDVFRRDLTAGTR